MAGYDADFYDQMWEGGRNAARLVLPPLFADWRPASMVDVGCGTGGWLSVAAEHGVTDLTGLDAESSLDGNRRFDDFTFISTDLEQPVGLDRAFDVAISIETAEHLAPPRAQGFVDDLCGLAPVVLFSAAWPGAGGTEHQNEQWPSYWVDRFAQCGYEPFEVSRTKYWQDRTVPMVLRVSLLLYARPPLPEGLAGVLMPPVMLDGVPAQMWDDALAHFQRPIVRAFGKAERLVKRRR